MRIAHKVLKLSCVQKIIPILGQSNLKKGTGREKPIHNLPWQANMEKMNPQQSRGQTTTANSKLDWKEWKKMSKKVFFVVCFFQLFFFCLYFICEKCSQQRVVLVVRWLSCKHPWKTTVKRISAVGGAVGLKLQRNNKANIVEFEWLMSPEEVLKRRREHVPHCWCVIGFAGSRETLFFILKIVFQLFLPTSWYNIQHKAQMIWSETIDYLFEWFSRVHHFLMQFFQNLYIFHLCVSVLISYLIETSHCGEKTYSKHIVLSLAPRTCLTIFHGL